MLEELFEKPKYIIFYREPSSIIKSHYTHSLKRIIVPKLVPYVLKANLYNYVNEPLDTLKKSKFDDALQNINYKIYNYNELFNDYINIGKRVLFLEFEKFFFNDQKELEKLENYLEIKIQYNFQKKNISYKNLIFLNLYFKNFLFRFVCIIAFQFLKILGIKDYRLKFMDKFIGFLNKFFNKEYTANRYLKDKKILNNYLNFHKENFKNFKKRINEVN